MTSSSRGEFARLFAAAGGGGLLLFLLEATDRLFTLRESLVAWYEPVFLVAYLAPAALVGLGGGLALAAVLLLIYLAFAGVSRPLAGRRMGAVTAAVITVVALAGVLALLSHQWPGVLEEPLHAVARKVDAKVTSIKPIVRNFGVFYYVGLCGLVAAGLAAAWSLLARPSRGGRIAAGLVCALALVGMIGAYALDSRYSFGRYELTIHLPALAVQTICGFLGAGFFLVALGDAHRRRLLFAIGALAGVVAVGCGFAFYHMGSSENLKAIIWRRSVVAKRAYQAVSFLADRDGDGYAAVFGGGDPDDGNPAIHPMAPEIAGNGVDDNGMGGDALGGAPFQAAPVNRTPRPLNFLFIAIDTQRASRMSLYGYERETTPRISEHAARARVFDRCYSPASNTGLAFAALQKSALRSGAFDKSRATLFGALAQHGYRTAQINARRDDVWLETKRWRRYRKVLLDGVATIDHTEGDALWDADRVTDRAIEYLAAIPADQRHATWVHYLDPHEPRRKMAPFDYGDSDSDLYDSEVAFADREIGRLLDSLAGSGTLENTVVVLMADHGEAFGEHGTVLHGNRPHDHQLWVPLVIWSPGLEPGRVVEPVTLLDVAPTVLSLLGLPELPRAEGKDLTLGVEGTRPIFAETPINLVEPAFHAFAVTQNGWRLIWDVQGNTLELYDLGTDPGELRNLADMEPERRESLRRELGKWLDSSPPPPRALRDPEGPDADQAD